MPELYQPGDRVLETYSLADWELMVYARDWTESRVMDSDEVEDASDEVIKKFVSTWYPGGWQAFTEDMSS